jgi:hypothetical protein
VQDTECNHAPREIVNNATNFCGRNLYIIATLLPNHLVDYVLYYSTRNIQIHLTLQLYHTPGSPADIDKSSDLQLATCPDRVMSH